MISNSKTSVIQGLKPGALIALVAALGAGFIAIVLLPGLKISGDLVLGNAALESVGEQERFPTIIRASLDSLHDRLMTRAYIQDSLDELRNAAAKMDAATQSISGAHAAALHDAWAQEREALKPLLNYSGVPYEDNEATGTTLNDKGRALEHDVTEAIHTSRHALPVLDTQLTAIAGHLQSDNVRAANLLRLFMMVGLGLAGVLIGFVALLLNSRQRQDENLRQARQQTTDILRTVTEGLFLLDEKLLIGSAYSSAMETLFQRTDIAGLAFEDLLKNIVSQKTLATASKFVKVLWTERTNEKLVKSINPLNEVEVNLDTGNGGFETRYLQFDFHRVRDDGKITHVLVSVSDVSARVVLARELQTTRSQSQAQVDTLLGILHIDPTQLSSFLRDSNAAMSIINAVLREPARDESMFRKKLDTLFRQAHAVKGEAAALGLSSIESRAHSFEEDLKTLRETPGLSGNDFLPLVIKLDDLLNHLQSVGELVTRLSRPPTAPRESDKTHTHTDVIVGGAGALKPVESADSGLSGMLQQLAARIANENGKRVALHCAGLESVPEHYRKTIKDVAIQAVRNAMVHGIEAVGIRRAAGKSDEGHIQLIFQTREEGGYRMTVEDDGQGLAMERIKEVALEKGLVTPDQASNLDSKQVYSLLFMPGFSTMANATKDAGRGVGMNLIADLMNQVGGKVGLASTRGRFTRLTVSLPGQIKTMDESAVA
jgi:HPt (histidine-containing phosphotransfer) domain-containing protein/PAS domain-containing protein